MKLKEEFQKGFRFGVDDAGEPDRDNINFGVLKQLGAQFIVHHFLGITSRGEETRKAAALMEQCGQNGVYLLSNLEISNWVGGVTDEEGCDWANGEDGCHYFRVPAEILAKYNASPYFAGLVYDEAEHMQINRNWVWVDGKKIDMPFFSETTGKTFRAAYDGFVGFGSAIAGGYLKAGTPYLLTEHVWPVLFHGFAKMGFTPSYKQMKEGWSNIWAQIAMGAARQYGRELWACLDLWGLDGYPSHSPEELKYNLIFSYLIGCDKSYVENLSYQGSLYSKKDGADILSAHGEVVRRFTSEFLPEQGSERGYSHRDYMPSIAIIRFDDTDGGQRASDYWPDRLLGSYDLKSTEETREWLKAWHIITHRTTMPESLSWNYVNTAPHRSFAPCNSPIVYDENAAFADLETLELVFLCGLYVSGPTLEAVGRLVKEKGLTAVTGARFAPAGFSGLYNGGTAEFADGKGRWVITGDMACGEVYEAVKSMLGNSDEMVYRFKSRTLVMKISEDGNSFTY